MLSEPDNRAKLIGPKLREAGWEENQIKRDHFITDGRIIVRDANIARKNTLEEDVRNTPETERFEVILAKPPFGGYEKWKTHLASENLWIEPVEEIIKRDYDLTAKNPNRKEEYEHRPPQELVASSEKEQKIASILKEIESLLANNQDRWI